MASNIPDLIIYIIHYLTYIIFDFFLKIYVADLEIIMDISLLFSLMDYNTSI